MVLKWAIQLFNATFENDWMFNDKLRRENVIIHESNLLNKLIIIWATELIIINGQRTLEILLKTAESGKVKLNFSISAGITVKTLKQCWFYVLIYLFGLNNVKWDFILQTKQLLWLHEKEAYYGNVVFKYLLILIPKLKKTYDSINYLI